MYQYIFDEDTTNKIINSTNKTNSVLEKFSEVDNKYSTLTSSSQNLDLQKMEYRKPTNEEVENKAKNSLEEYKQSNISSINNSYDKKSEIIDESIKNAKLASNKEKEELKSEYASL